MKKIEVLGMVPSDFIRVYRTDYIFKKIKQLKDTISHEWDRTIQDFLNLDEEDESLIKNLS